jgi:hypothetical protein
MTEEALQIDFRPQPSGIAVVTSAPISTIAESGNYAAFQDLIDGYASSFAKVHVFSPSGGSVVKPLKAHRVKWHSGPRWLSPTNGLWWSVLSNRREFENIELVRTFGPRAGVVGKALSKLAKSPHVSSSDDLIGNTWRDRTGWRAAPTKVVNRLGLLRANMLAATLDWEVEYLSETGYTKDLLLGKTGLPTDVYTPVGTTDPNRHPVVLWAGPVTGDDSVSLIAESALATKSMIENVEFVVVANADDGKHLQADVTERELPVTIAAFDQVEPLVDLIERTWACVTVPSSGFPHGFGMFAASAGVPMISVGELDESHGFKNHLNYMGVEPDSHDAVAYALQLLRRWSTWSLRIGSAGQQLIEDRYSTKTVALREGEQLARIARDEELETDSPVQLKALRPYLSPATGEALPFGIDTDAESVKEEPEAADQYSGAGFDMVAAALAGLASDAAAAKSSPPKADSSSEDMGQDAISALFAANDAAPAAEPAGDMGQDAISALFAANDADPEVPAAPPVDLDGGDMGQDAISALFAANDPAPAAEPAGDMDQDAISALFAANDADPEVPSAEPVDLGGGDLDQDAISALFAANDPAPAAEPAGDMDQDAISAMFAANDPAPAAEPAGDMDQDAISAMFAANEPAPATEPAGDMDQDAISALFAANEPAPTGEPAGDMGQDAISAMFAANDTADVVEPEPVPAVESTGEMDQDAISALFASNDPAPASSPEPVNEPDEDFVSAIIAAKNNSPEKVLTAEDLDDTDVPKVNIVKFDGASDVEEEEDVADEFDSIDVDPGLIASILEGKDVDPYV